MAIDRTLVRNEFAGLLTTALTGSGKPVQSVYAYRVSNFDGASPVVVVASAGSRHEITGFTSTTQDGAMLDIFTFVLYANTTDGWTEQNAEDALSDIEVLIAAEIRTNQNGTNWDRIEFLNDSVIGVVEIGGVQYIRELQTLLFVEV